MKNKSLYLLLLCLFRLGISTEINVEELLSTMSLRDKIAQLCFIAAATNDITDKKIIEDWINGEPSCKLNQSYVEQMIQEHHIGGLIFYSQTALPEMQEKLTRHYQHLSKVPLFITLDAENGLASRLNPDHVVRFPQQMTLGAINNVQLIYEFGREVGKQLKSLGVHLNYAPVIDVNTNPLNPIIGMRSFGSDKEEVARKGIAYMNGLQDEGIIACAKHFPGHGDTSTDSHLCLPVLKQSVQQLRSTDLYPFERLINEGVMSIMTGHLSIPAFESTPKMPSSLSRKIVTHLLKEEMQFDGLIITDAMVMRGVAEYAEPGEVELKALQAGNTIVLCPADVVKVLDRVEAAVIANEISEQEINQKVKKVLYAKKWVMKRRTRIPFSNETLNTAKAYSLNDLLYEKAMTLVKSHPAFPNDLKKTVPLFVNTDSHLEVFEKELNTSLDYQTLSKSFKENLSLIEVLKMVQKDQEQSFEQFSNVIICVSSTSFKTIEEKIAFAEWLKDAKLNNKSITLVYFCSPYQMLVSDAIDTIVLAYEMTPSAQKAAAKVLNGAIKAEGQLPVKL